MPTAAASETNAAARTVSTADARPRRGRSRPWPAAAPAGRSPAPRLPDDAGGTLLSESVSLTLSSSIAPPASPQKREELIGRKLRPPGAQRFERVPKFRLGGLLVQRLVDVGHVERLNRRREPLQLTERRFERVGQRELELVQERKRRLAHHHHELRLDDVQLAREPRLRLLGVAPGE